MAARNLVIWENLTELEQVVYSCFPMSGHLYDNYDAATYNDACGTWVDVKDWSKATGLSMNQIKGVLSSLVKKGLVIVDYYDEDANWLTFTEAGYALLKNVA